MADSGAGLTDSSLYQTMRRVADGEATLQQEAAASDAAQPPAAAGTKPSLGLDGAVVAADAGMEEAVAAIQGGALGQDLRRQLHEAMRLARSQAEAQAAAAAVRQPPQVTRDEHPAPGIDGTRLFADEESKRPSVLSGGTARAYRFVTESGAEEAEAAAAGASGFSLLEAARAAYARGELREAIRLLEGAVRADDELVEAWVLLGKVHAEVEDDVRAIVCLEQAVSRDAYCQEALLALGVSYANESDPARALECLRAWVSHNPTFQGMEEEEEEEAVADPYSDGTDMDDVLRLMLAARQQAPDDRDVQEVLGVLYNVSYQLKSAVAQLRAALEHPGSERDHVLLNRLGATLANSGRNREAIEFYDRALALRPNFPRATYNRGLALFNLGDHLGATECYLKALRQVPDAAHIWGNVRVCLTLLELQELLQIASRQDSEAVEELLVSLDWYRQGQEMSKGILEHQEGGGGEEAEEDEGEEEGEAAAASGGASGDTP